MTEKEGWGNFYLRVFQTTGFDAKRSVGLQQKKSHLTSGSQKNPEKISFLNFFIINFFSYNCGINPIGLFHGLEIFARH